MWAPIRLFWQLLVGAAVVATGSKFVVVALPHQVPHKVHVAWEAAI